MEVFILVFWPIVYGEMYKFLHVSIPDTHTHNAKIQLNFPFQIMMDLCIHLDCTIYLLSLHSGWLSEWQASKRCVPVSHANYRKKVSGFFFFATDSCWSAYWKRVLSHDFSRSVSFANIFGINWFGFAFDLWFHIFITYVFSMFMLCNGLLVALQYI